MLLNSYAVLDLFLCALRLLVAVALAGVAFCARRPPSRGSDKHQQSATEDRGYLAMQLAAVSLGLSLAAWPLLYLLLHSYIPQWPGVMCIHGVTQIGRGSQGASRFLPGLLGTLEWLRPAVIFTAGGWCLVYALGRRVGKGMSRAALSLLAAVGILSSLDAGLELTYLLTPKRPARQSSGCCSLAQVETPGAGGYFTGHVHSAPNWLWTAEGAALAGTTLALGWLTQRARHHPVRRWMAPACLAVVVCLVLSKIFIIDVAAPWLLRLPYHHCVYCLFVEVPESLLAVLGLVGGSLAVGWAGLLAAVDGGPTAQATTARLLRWGTAGFATFCAMLSWEMVLAR